MWDQSRHDSENSAKTDAINIGTGRELWRYTDSDFGYGYWSDPVVDINETIYMYSSDVNDYASIFAFNPDGTLKWKFQDAVPYYAGESDYEMAPLIGPDGTIYYIDLNGDRVDYPDDVTVVYAINSDGTLKWKQVFSDPNLYHYPKGIIKFYNNTVYVIDENVLYALDSHTGAIKWTYINPTEYDFGQGFAISNGFVYLLAGFSSYDWLMDLFKIDANTGTLIWTNRIRGGYGSTNGIIVKGNYIYIIASDNVNAPGYSRTHHLFVKYDTNGIEIWRKLEPVVTSGEWYASGPSYFPAIDVDSSVIYFSTVSWHQWWLTLIDGRIFKYDLDGNPLWVSETDLSGISPVIDGNGYIYTGDDQAIIKVDPSDGSVIWTYPVNYASALAVGNRGVIYFRSGDWPNPLIALASETIELPVFGDGSDGDVVISQDSTLTRHTNFRNLTIDEGVKLNTAGYRVRVQNKLIINGIIHNNGGGSEGGSAPNLNPPCDCVDCAGQPGTGGYGYGGNGGDGNNERPGNLGGGGSGATITSIDLPSLSDLINFGFPYAGGGGGGGGSSRQVRPFIGPYPPSNMVVIYGGGGKGGNGGGIVIIQAYEIAYGPNGYVQSNGEDGGAGITRYSHSRDWFFDCCQNFIEAINYSNLCKTGGFNCADYAGWGCPDFGGSVNEEDGGGGGGGGGGAQLIVSNRGFNPSRHQTNPGNGGVNTWRGGHVGQPGQSGNVYYYQVGAAPLYVTVSALPDQIISEGISQITVNVTDNSGMSIEGATVNISATNGTLDPTSGTTDVNGNFISIYTAPTVTDIQTFTITAIASKLGYVDGSGSTQITVRTPAHVTSATLTVDKNDCITPCTVNGTVSWTNIGGTTGTFDPAILVNTVPTSLGTSVTIDPGQTITYQFSLQDLTVGTYQICASPDSGTACQIVIVRTPVTPANIVATAITPSVTTCIAPCDMTVDITWTNNGGTSGTFIPTITVNGTPTTLPEESLDPGASITKTFSLTGLMVGTYNICSEPNTFPCATVTVLTSANIVATAITPNVTTCITPCDVTVDITWTNNGGTSGTFTPAIVVDGTSVPLATSETLNPTQSVTKTFTLTGLAIGAHTICSEPNTLPCATVTVTGVVQAGFGNIGMILLGGLLIGMLISKKCEDYKTKKECEEHDCQWIEKKKKCVPFSKEDQYLIAKLREKGAVGTPICKGEECQIGKWVAIYRKGEKPIIIHDP